MAKQTAVEWLIQKIDEQVYRDDNKYKVISINISFETMIAIRKQAKAMEKEQIMNAFIDGKDQEGFEGEAEQYFNETYHRNI